MVFKLDVFVDGLVARQPEGRVVLEYDLELALVVRCLVHACNLVCQALVFVRHWWVLCCY